MQQIVDSVRKKKVTRQVNKIGFNYQSVAFVKSHLHPFLQALSGL